MDRKMTAWKKSRKFGDIYGGRQRVKLADNIFHRAHGLQKPGASEALPILIEDNPSRDFFFPISAQEANEALKVLPKEELWNSGEYLMMWSSVIRDCPATVIANA